MTESVGSECFSLCMPASVLVAKPLRKFCELSFPFEDGKGMLVETLDEQFWVGSLWMGSCSPSKDAVFPLSHHTFNLTLKPSQVSVSFSLVIQEHIH